jgi:enoyl-CoA hydratase
MKQTFSTLIRAKQSHVVTVLLNRPQVLNALNDTMFDELDAVLSESSSDPDTRCILISGFGDRAFAAGADIRSLSGANEKTGLSISKRGQEIFQRIEESPKPVIACVNGVALGGGCELALACTFRIASESASFGLPEVKLGLIPGYGGTQRIVRLIGRAYALQMLLTGQPIGAAEALRLGLVNEVIPSDQLMTRAKVIAQRIVTMAPLATSAVLDVINASAKSSSSQGFEIESRSFSKLCGTQDKEEGLSAFLEKRPPSWRGC